MDPLERLEAEALTRAAATATPHAVAELRAELLGRGGTLTAQLRGLSSGDPEARRAAGRRLNAAKARIEAALTAACERLEAVQAATRVEQARCDVTLPGRRTQAGFAHPLRLVQEEVMHCLMPLGFCLATGPQIEHDWYNFEALNMPADHPARDMQDTFFLRPDLVLRTHTSNVQIRAMLAEPPPLRLISTGMVYRHDEVDATHSPAFHQLEGLWVDDRVTFADLKGVLQRLAHHLFGIDAAVRFRPSYFPFTEPSLELDVGCHACSGAGSSCTICRGSGWLEILGAGMVDPAVLSAVGYDPEQVQGFAFGMGIERIALLRWGIADIRQFYENDLRFLAQFSAPGRSGGPLA